MIPMIVVPLIILTLLPLLALLAPLLERVGDSPLQELEGFLSNMPGSIAEQVAGFDEIQIMIYLALVYMMAPMYLILPLMVASVIAADSFAGEKERKTLEALIYTPTTDLELVLAKMLAAWLPAVAIAWGGFIVYSVMVNVAGWPTMGRLFFPNLMWLVLALWVAPAVAGLGLGVTVLVSARAKSFQEAYQIGGVIVLPIILLIVGQATGVMYFSVGMVFALGLVCFLIDAALLWYGGKSFRRTEIIAQL
jgi:ABC-type Na+ efflux pump permease subunit